MFQQLLAITRNTFFESIRQPIMLVVLVAAAVLIVLSNPLSAFTMDENQRMLVDIGLATVFMAGAVLAAFIATNVLGREIENKTASLVNGVVDLGLRGLHEMDDDMMVQPL